MSEPQPLPDIQEAVRTMLAGRKPTDPAIYRKYILDSQILPSISRWGFDSRFQQEQSAMHPKQAQTFARMKEHLTGRGAIVALVGPRGLGKTTLAAQFAIETAWRNYEEAGKDAGPRVIQHVIYKKCAKLIARYKSLYADSGSIETEQLLESLEHLCREQEFLVIDEVHDCDDQKMKLRVLTDLIDRRYSNCRDTVLIANQTGEDFAATIGDSILSRLGEHGAILQCSWPSYRTK